MYVSEVYNNHHNCVYCLACECVPILLYGRLIIFWQVSCDGAYNLKVSDLFLEIAGTFSPTVKIERKLAVALS